MNKSKIKCPSHHFNKLHKFGFYKQTNQKYQCKNYNIQFAPDYVSNLTTKDYPKCPKCCVVKYLHH